MVFGIINVIFNIDNVYIADYSNNRIRKVTVSTGIVTTIAGTGTAGYSGDSGAATSATLKYPSGVTLDSSGGANTARYHHYLPQRLYIHDRYRRRVHR